MLEEEIDGRDEAIEDLHPVELAELVGELLGYGGVVELQEGVVGLDEAEAALLHLPGEPFVAIDVDLAGEGKHGLQADVHEAEVGVEEVKVEDALRSRRKARRGRCAMPELDAAAMFLAAQDGDQAVAVRLFA